MADATLKSSSPRPPQERRGFALPGLSRVSSRRERMLLLAATAPMFAGVLALGLAVDEPAEAVSVLFTIPIALVAIEFGAAAGLAAAGLALALFGVSVAVSDQDVSALGFITRGAGFAVLGGLLGHLSTRLRGALSAVEERERRLQAILDNTTAVIYVKDLRGRYLLVNRRFEQLFHIRRSEAVGKGDADLFPEYMADAFRANDRRVLRDREVTEFEEVAPHDDGPHTYISIKFALSDPDGEPYAICGISTDISARKRAEQELKESKDRIRAVLDTAPQAFVSMDQTGTITGWNRAAETIFGWPASAALGQPLSGKILPERHRAAYEQGLEHFLATGHDSMLNQQIELVARHRDGHEFPVEVLISPVRVRGGFSFNAFLRVAGDRTGASAPAVHADGERGREPEEQRS